MTDQPAAYLLVISEREALSWILAEGRTAFPGTTRREVEQLSVGDHLFLLTTRGCFHNPTRDATRVIGTATVTSPVVKFHDPVEVAGRSFPRGCDLEIGPLAPYLTGVELAPLVEAFEAFGGRTAWGMLLRRPLVRLTTPDARLLMGQLQRVSRSRVETLPEYLDKIRPVRSPKAGRNVPNTGAAAGD